MEIQKEGDVCTCVVDVEGLELVLGKVDFVWGDSTLIKGINTKTKA
jgi:hypothetical protein